MARINDNTDNDRSYLTAINYISDYSKQIDSIRNQLGISASQKIVDDIMNSAKQISVFADYQKLLPSLEYLKKNQPFAEQIRAATIEYANIEMLKKIQYDISTMLQQSTALKVLSQESIVEKAMFLNIQSNLVKANELNLLAEKSLASFNWNHIGYQLEITRNNQEKIQNIFSNFYSDYSQFLKSINSNIINITSINPNLIKLPSIEYFTNSNLLESISVKEIKIAEKENIKNEIIDENQASLRTWLPQVDSGLPKLWNGAIQALNSDNPDRVRHFITSVRELYTHVFHILAPDDQIKLWSNEATHYHDGKPTRKARLLFICRNIQDDNFSKFVNKDIDATVEFIQMFQKGTHSIEPNFSDNQLIAIKSKAEATLRFILEIHFTTNTNQ